MHKARRRMIIMALLAILIHVYGCHFHKVGPDPIPAPDPEFQAFPTPRTFDAPGTIFRIDATGKSFGVEDLSDRIKIRKGEESIGQYKSTMRTKLGNFLKFLNTNQISLGIGLEQNSNAIINIEFLADSLTREKTFDNNIKNALNDAIYKIEWKDNNKYYIIRETISAQKIFYKFSSSFNDTIGVKISLNELINTNSNFKKDLASKYDLIQSFSQPHRIFYKVEEIIQFNGLDGKITFGIEPTDTTPVWQDEVR